MEPKKRHTGKGEDKLKPMFTVHEGEFLVGDYINRNLGSKYDVWVPTKDTGVDLLVTSQTKGRKPVKIQVKFSRSFGSKDVPPEELLAFGWYTLNPAKIRDSAADLWIFVILTLRHEPHFVIIPTRELQERLPESLPGKQSKWHLYLVALRRKRCYNFRDLPKGQKQLAVLGQLSDPKPDFDYSEFYNNWKLLDELSR